jgi:LytS/YehU family sensor histidine kinase
MLWLITGRLLGLPTAYGTGPGGTEAFDTFLYRHAIHALVVCGMATFVYVRRRWAAHSIAALRALQLERATIEKQVLESELAAMQARVDPEFLRTTLFRVERLYETDEQAADRLLKDFIVYLRAAIPRSQDPGSTVAREIQLANAYLSIVGMHSTDCLVTDESGGAIAARARMPPMVMLPLVNHAHSRHVECARGDERLAVHVQVLDGGLVVRIHDDANGFDPYHADEPGIRRLRDWLTTMHGASAKVTFTKTAAGTDAVLAMPYEDVTAAAELS